MIVRLPRLLLAAVTVLVLVSGCGGDDESTPTAGGSSPTETTTVSETPSPVAPDQSETVTPTPTPEPTPPPSQPTKAPTKAPPTKAPPTEVPPTEVPPTNGPPSTYEEVLALFDQASGSTKYSRFASPSGNLYCVLDSPYLPPSCELGSGAIRDPGSCPADGPSQSVGRIEFTEAAPQPICNSDTIREPGAPVLGYGRIATWPDTTVTCVMERFGVACVNPSSNQGFFLAKGSYQIFGG